MRSTYRRLYKVCVFFVGLWIMTYLLGFWDNLLPYDSLTPQTVPVRSALGLHDSNSLEEGACEYPPLHAHIAVVTPANSSAIRETVRMLNSLLVYRTCDITLHIFTQPIGFKILYTLFTTWQLPGVYLQFYNTEFSVISDELKGTSFVTTIHQLLPLTVNKVIYVSRYTRFVNDVRLLWQQFTVFNDEQSISMISTGSKKNIRYYIDVILLDLYKIRNKSQPLTAIHAAAGSWATVQQSLFHHRSHIHPLPCSWSVRPEDGFPISSCGVPNAFYWNIPPEKHADLPQDNSTARLLAHVWDVEHVSLYPLRTAANQCLTPYQQLHDNDNNNYNDTSSSSNNNATFSSRSDKCNIYRTASLVALRTHLYFLSSRDSEDFPPHDNDDMNTSDSGDGGDHVPREVEVTLVTVFTVERYENFLKFIRWWPGPISAVAYCEHHETNTLVKLFRSSPLLQHKRIDVHVVYKHGKYFPINTLRNIGITQSSSPYTFYVDVDLVPNQDIYRSITNRLDVTRHMEDYKEALVIPAFESRVPFDDNVPRNKQQLLPYIENKNVTGFKMYRKWNLGHKPTNFAKWTTADAPYNVTFSDAFEPYVVLPTSAMPRYEETLLERMGDKIAYGLHVYAMGYTFTVLHDSYVLHLPHPTSKGTQLWAKDDHYRRCGGTLMKDFKTWIQKQYPDREYKGKL